MKTRYQLGDGCSCEHLDVRNLLWRLSSKLNSEPCWVTHAHMQTSYAYIIDIMLFTILPSCLLLLKVIYRFQSSQWYTCLKTWCENTKLHQVLSQNIDMGQANLPKTQIHRRTCVHGPLVLNHIPVAMGQKVFHSLGSKCCSFSFPFSKPEWSGPSHPSCLFGGYLRWFLGDSVPSLG